MKAFATIQDMPWWVYLLTMSACLMFGIYFLTRTSISQADSWQISVNNKTYQVSASYVGSPKVAWDMCISRLQVLTNQGWINANAIERHNVVCWYAGEPLNTDYNLCVMLQPDIHGFC